MSFKSTVHPYLLQIMKAAMKEGASDIHIKAGIMPVIRLLGKLQPLSPEFGVITPHEIDEMIESLLDEEQKYFFRINKELDLGVGVTGLGRFRLNIFRQRGSSRIVIRNIPFKVPQLKELNLPPILQKIANFERGLVLITGVTGSGKSTTLAAIVDQINRTKNKHILTIEDPIEYLIRDRKSIITQRELGVDALSFSVSLRAALRQDPDVILIGEMRDKETIETALTAAATGHLVLSTLHTLDARETVNRILAVFEPHQQMQIRLQLASVLNAVVSQRLAKKADQSGFIPATEVMINNTRIKEMINDPQKTREIPLAIAEGRTSYGMQTFDQSLIDLVRSGLVTMDQALTLSNNPEDFKIHISGISNHNQNRSWNAPPPHEGQNNEWNKIQDVELDTQYVKSIFDKKKRRK